MVRHLLAISAVSLALLGVGGALPSGAAEGGGGAGPGGPILVIANPANPFSRYYSQILEAEGLNEYRVAELPEVSGSLLSGYDVAILGEGAVSGAQAHLLGEWVQGGGNLIAMRPDPDLASLLGLSGPEGALADAYLRVDTGTGPGAGIVGETIQFHGSADRYGAPGAQTIATLYSDAGTATANPAVTLRAVGPNGGHAAAFAYDLARSVVYTRQGNPAWAGDERDGTGPIRSDDLFFGAKAGDEQPDWVDLSKAQIPQADEQQRLLTNLIEEMNLDRKPLPRFWFLPRDAKAAVVMTGDDHANGGTAGRFARYEALSPPGCSVSAWECVRATSYVYPATPLTDAEAAAFTARGFELALHTTINCRNWDDAADLDAFYVEELTKFAAAFPSVPAPQTNRMHCIVWSDWATQPEVELAHGIRLDTNYYYWPSTWAAAHPGMFTGSGMPMRFAALDGSTIDVYQAATQMTDESGQAYPATAEALLDGAVGPQGFYGVFTANMHTDLVASAGAEAIVAAAQARGVPVVSARQMLTWLDGRNGSSFGSVSWSGDRLGFTIDPGPGATGLRAMVPTGSAAGRLREVRRDGVPVPTTVRTVKGREYAFFDAVAGGYEASYGAGSELASPPPGGGRRRARARARLLRIVRLPGSGEARMVFAVSGPGWLAVRSPAIAGEASGRRRRGLLLRRIVPVGIRVQRARRVAVTIRLKPPGRRLLASRHRLEVGVEIRFRPAGTAARQTRQTRVLLVKGTAPKRRAATVPPG